MKSESSNSDSLADAAGHWLARHDRGLTPAEERAFAAWLSADPRHAAEWETISGTWHLLDDAAALPEIAAEATALELRTRPLPRRRRSRRWFAAASLAVAAALVIGFFLSTHRPTATPIDGAEPAVVVLAAQSKRLALPDGSTVDVRTGGEVTVDFSGPARRVNLIAGEAFFAVAHDPARPFLVETNGVTVRAVGTAFVVRRDTAAVDVVVTEGRVQLTTREGAGNNTVAAAPLVDAGMGALVSHGPAAPVIATRAVSSTEQDELLAWRKPRLQFSRAPLPDVLAAFREHSAQRIRLGDPALSTRTLNGTLRADNVEGFLRLAEGTLRLRVVREPDGQITLLPAP